MHIEEGAIESRFVDLLGADVMRVLSPLQDSGPQTSLHCSRQPVRDQGRRGDAEGDVRGHRQDGRLSGDGSINLGSEQLALMLTPRPKQASLVSLPSRSASAALWQTRASRRTPGAALKGAAGAAAARSCSGRRASRAVSERRPRRRGADLCGQALGQAGLRGGAPAPSGQSQQRDAVAAAGEPGRRHRPRAARPVWAVSSPKTAVPRRSYERVTVAASAGGFAVRLDEKPLKSPGRQADGAAVGGDGRSDRGGVERPGAKPNLLQLPMTRIAATALDRIPAVRDTVVAELAGYAETELVCHRAGDPPSWWRGQRTVWQRLLDWLAQHYDAPLVATTGILPKAQPAASLQAITRALAALDDFRLAGVSVAVAATGSLVIGLALSAGRVSAAQAFDAAELDATFQIERWGEDEIARLRRVELRAELETAAGSRRCCAADPSQLKKGIAAATTRSAEGDDQAERDDLDDHEVRHAAVDRAQGPFGHDLLEVVGGHRDGGDRNAVCRLTAMSAPIHTGSKLEHVDDRPRVSAGRRG